MKIPTLLCLLVATTHGRTGFGPGEQDWAHVQVRPGAFMFWWLYETTAVSNATEKPLVIWLQGGPGGSSTGIGNLAELGPLDENLKPRSQTWIKEVNLLFIDNPVGVGFSYVTDDKLLTKDVKEISNDLIICIEGFYKTRPDFLKVPLYIASQSYGGKMAVQFAYDLFKKGGSNIKGVNVIAPWISPIDSVLHWAPFLLNFGVIDQQGYEKLDASAKETQILINEGEYMNATDLWAGTQGLALNLSYQVGFYNVLKEVKSECVEKYCPDDLLGKIQTIMNDTIKEALKLNVTGSAFNHEVFRANLEDFMKPVVDIVEKLLDETTLKVQVVTGQLDVIVDTPGTVVWVDNMKWSRSNEWLSTNRALLSVNGINEGYQKKLGRFSLYWVNRSGHKVPRDNPAAMHSILMDFIESD